MKKILIVALVLFSAFSYAGPLKRHMIITQTGSTASIDNNSNGNYDLNTISLVGGYYYTLNEYLQVGGQGSYYIYSSMDDTAYSLTPGLIFNLPMKAQDGIENSFYAQLNVGYMGSTGEVSTVSEFYYTTEIGKRFALLENLSYSPSIGMLHLPFRDGNSDPSFIINLVKISILF